MPIYLDIVSATHDTVCKLLLKRQHQRRGVQKVRITCEGGATASVMWDHQTAAVTVNMPTLPPDAKLTRVEADRMLGYVIHEVCHVLHTDRMAWAQACREGPAIQRWTNALEDIRIEDHEIRQGHYPNLRNVLSSLVTHTHWEGMQQNGDGALTDPAYLATVLGRMANGYDIPSAVLLPGQVPPHLAPVLAHALAGIGRCHTTTDVLALARECHRLHVDAQSRQQAQQQAKQQAQQKGGKGQEEAQEGQQTEGQDEGQEDGPGQGQGQGQQGQESEQDEGQEDGQGQGEEDEADEGQGQAPGAGGTTPPAPLDAIADGFKKLIKGAQDKLDLDTAALTRGGFLSTYTPKQSRIEPVSGAGHDPAAVSRLLSGMPKPGALAHHVAGIVQAPEQHLRSHRETSGRLDRRALARMRTGAVDVFSRRSITPGHDTAVLILIDGSSSMEELTTPRTNRLSDALVAGYHIAAAIESAGSPVMLAVFHSLAGKGSFHPGCQLRVMKPWATPTSHAASCMMQTSPHGGTPLSPAILLAADLLQNIPATRRIVLSITDGECNFKAQAVQTVCRIAATMGVEVGGIGIACPAVIKSFPPGWAVNVTDLGQLASAGLGILTRRLEPEQI